MENYLTKSDITEGLSFTTILPDFKGVAQLNIDWVNDLSAARDIVLTAIQKILEQFTKITQKITDPIKTELTAKVVKPFKNCITVVDKILKPSVEHSISSASNYTKVNYRQINFDNFFFNGRKFA